MSRAAVAQRLELRQAVGDRRGARAMKFTSTNFSARLQIGVGERRAARFP